MLAQLPVKKTKKIAFLGGILSSESLTVLNSFPQVKEYFSSRNSTLEDFRRRPLRESSMSQDNLGVNADDTVDTSVRKTIAKTNDALAPQISTEEYNMIVEKLQHVLSLAAGTIEPESLLYLEQQLTDMFGFTITGTMDGYALPFNTGRIKAEKHLRRYLNDKLSDHDRYIEAGLDSVRSSFGWFAEQNQLSETGTLKEQYGVSLPLHLLQDWDKNHHAIKSWFASKKVLVINPFDQRAVVASIYNIKTHHPLKYQFGGSPELIRQGHFWSPAAQGRACMLFIDDQDDRVSLGPILFPTMPQANI